ncbi:MAG: hypothetical protein LC107_08185 [Chitinophagales bacterium]|nr:hypothetical protein [Chitinophagales bacterium]
MKILLTNLGNRNITFQGKTYNEWDISNQNHKHFVNFANWTKKLNDDFEKEKAFLDINIINPIINQKENYDYIVLYYTDQSDYETRTDQDTIHEAAIIKRILIDRYEYIEDRIITIAVKSKVIDNGGLLKFYRSELTRIKKKYDAPFITICDAGGTAQQKMALKVIAEYVFDASQYEILYVEKNSLITDVNVNEYRKVINSEQAISLIKHGEFGAAAELLDYKEILNFQKAQKYDWKGKVMAHVIYRFNQNKNEAKHILGNLQVSNELLKNYMADSSHKCNFSVIIN